MCCPALQKGFQTLSDPVCNVKSTQSTQCWRFLWSPRGRVLSTFCEKLQTLEETNFKTNLNAYKKPWGGCVKRIANRPAFLRGRGFPKPQSPNRVIIFLWSRRRIQDSGQTLLCPLELSNAAFITSAALLWGKPVPHALYPGNQSPSYAKIDVFGDRLLNDEKHAATGRNRLSAESMAGR
jgi:hypothetical protein